jgi:putative protein-disulfide isomerase
MEHDMTPTTLHYIHDPFCGWCYGAAPLVKAARQVLPVQAHGGGMMAGDRRVQVSASLREYVRPHDLRIQQASGQPFGEAYRDGLLRDTTAVLDSALPIAAMLAVRQLTGGAAQGQDLDLLSRLQTAHYVNGQQVSRPEVLVAHAQALGLEAGAFEEALAHALVHEAGPHILATRQLMGRIGAQGFPSFALESQGRLMPVAWQGFLGDPAGFAAHVAGLLPAQPDPAGAPLGCGPESCAL